MKRNILIVDTNILLLSADNLLVAPAMFKCSEIVIPETCIDEIDSKKSGHTEIAFQAREFGRLLTKAEKIKVEHTDTLVSTYLQLDGIIIHIVSAKEYPKSNDDDPSIRNDRKILHIAKEIANLCTDYNVLFCSNDVMCRIRGESLGLQTVDFKEVQEVDTEFTQGITVSSDIFANLPADPYMLHNSHTVSTFNYRITDSYTGQVKFANIINNRVVPITHEDELRLRKQEMPPINGDQLLMSALIQHPNVDIVVAEALAGSGKTVTAISNAMVLVAGNSPYSNIVYIRNSVDDIGERDEEIGFLSGNDEKVKGYLYPFYDTLDSIVRRSIKTKSKSQDIEQLVQEGIASLLSRYNMQAMIAMGTRGRTFENSIVIIDEAQNIGKSTMQKLLTRIGKNCKVIIIGSLKQIDSKYLNKYTSGLSVVLNAVSKIETSITIAGVSLTKVVRGPITEWAERIFSS